VIKDDYNTISIYQAICIFSIPVCLIFSTTACGQIGYPIFGDLIVITATLFPALPSLPILNDFFKSIILKYSDSYLMMGGEVDVPKVKDNKITHTNFANRDIGTDSELSEKDSGVAYSSSNKPKTTPLVDDGEPSSSSTSNTNNSSVRNQDAKRSRHEHMSKVYQHKLEDLHERIKTLNLDLINAKDEKEQKSINESIDDEIESMAFISKAMEEEIKKSRIESNTSISKRDIEKVDKNESEEEPSNKK